MTESEPTEKPSPLNAGLRGIGGIIGGIVGLVVGRYVGLHLLIPLGLGLAFGAIAAKLLPQRPKPLVGAFAVQIGHGCWMAIGLALLGTFDLNLIDVVILVSGAIWLLVRPGLAPVLLLSGFQLLALVINSITFSAVAFGSTQHKALLVHILLRLLALALMSIGLYQIRKSASADDTETTLESTA